MPSLDYRSVRASISLAQVLELVGFSLCERRGNQLRGPCPIHRSSSAKSRSFSANLDKNADRCFTCGSSGNQLDLWAAVTNLDLYQATIQLCERLQLEIPSIHPPANPGRNADSHRTEKRNP